jgi:hypothetical protein
MITFKVTSISIEDYKRDLALDIEKKHHLNGECFNCIFCKLDAQGRLYINCDGEEDIEEHQICYSVEYARHLKNHRSFKAGYDILDCRFCGEMFYIYRLLWKDYADLNGTIDWETPEGSYFMIKPSR